MSPNLKLFLELLEKKSLPASRLRASMEDLRTPLDSGLLRRPAGRGAGEAVSVLNAEGFRDWIRAKHPGAFGDLASDVPRVANLAMNRDTKKGRQGLDHYTVLARVHGVPEHLEPEDRAGLECIREATRRFGGACLSLGVPDMGRTRSDPTLPKGLRLMTIEGPTNFDHSEELADQADVFLRCGMGGRMRDAFIDWIAAQEPREIIHFGDYDPVGLQEFVKLARRMPGIARFHLVEDLEQRFKTFNNRSILEKENNRKILASLPSGVHPTSDRILELMHRRAPLEQEVALIEINKQV